MLDMVRKRSVVGTGIVLLLFVALASSPSGAQQQEKIRLHYFTWAGGAAADYIREDFIEPFQELNPHIEIYYEAVSFGQFFDKLVTYHLAGTPPDLMHMSVGYVNEYAANGMLLNLQPLFERDLNPDDFFLEPMKAVRYPSMEDGDLYAIPFAFVLTSLYYNKGLFDDAGLMYPDDDFTWEDVRTYGRTLTRDRDGDGVMDQWGFFSTRNYTLLDPVIHAFGGRILDDDYNVVVTSPEAVAGAQFLVDLIHQDRVAPHPNLGFNQTVLFQQGKLAMSVALTNNIHEYRQVGDTLDWDVALMPIGPAGRVVRLWPDSFAISAQSPNVEAAWEYIKFVITQDKLDRYSGERKVPIYKPLATSAEWLELDKVPNKMKFIEAIPYGHPLEFRPNWGEWEGQRSLLNPAWYGEMPVEQALANWGQAIENAVRPFREQMQK